MLRRLRKGSLLLCSSVRSQQPASFAARYEQAAHSSTPAADNTESNKDIGIFSGGHRSGAGGTSVAVLVVSICVSAAFLGMLQWVLLGHLNPLARGGSSDKERFGERGAQCRGLS